MCRRASWVTHRADHVVSRVRRLRVRGAVPDRGRQLLGAVTVSPRAARPRRRRVLAGAPLDAGRPRARPPVHRPLPRSRRTARRRPTRTPPIPPGLLPRRPAGPVDDVAWQRVWPAVRLPAWPDRPAEAGGRYTTVTQWWTNQYAFLDGETYDCNKRPGFLEVLDVPRRTGLAIELAANVHPGETDDRALLAANGWHLVDPEVVAGTPEAFRRYVQGSRGEFSAAKPAYVRARPGWVSDRTVCYLASGRPCVLQATGAERHLPPTAGLRFFSSPEEAVEALARVEADYAMASRAARALAEEVFATGVVIPRILAAAGVA